MTDNQPVLANFPTASPKKPSRARRESVPVVPPNPSPTPGDPDRDQWIEETCRNFVTPDPAKRAYYRAVLERLWPPGHGIPGPHVTQEEVRDAIDDCRGARHTRPEPYRPYRDPFRRVRELQGEEGLVGIIKEGTKYQLASLQVASKRVPRTALSDRDWSSILARYKGKCAVCGRTEDELPLQPDHKIPRVRRGGSELSNWQPLCVECNNFKSTACRACELDCHSCPWAFPEKYKSLRLSAENIQGIRKLAQERDVDPNALANKILSDYLTSQGLDG